MEFVGQGCETFIQDFDTGWLGDDGIEFRIRARHNGLIQATSGGGEFGPPPTSGTYGAEVRLRGDAVAQPTPAPGGQQQVMLQPSTRPSELRVAFGFDFEAQIKIGIGGENTEVSIPVPNAGNLTHLRAENGTTFPGVGSDTPVEVRADSTRRTIVNVPVLDSLIPGVTGSFSLDASAYAVARYRTTGVQTPLGAPGQGTMIQPAGDLTCEVGLTMWPTVTIGYWIVRLTHREPIDGPPETLGGAMLFPPQSLRLASPDIRLDRQVLDLAYGTAYVSVTNAGAGILTGTVMPTQGILAMPAQFNVNAGQSAPITITGRPPGTLSFQSNDPDSPLITLNVVQGANPTMYPDAGAYPPPPYLRSGGGCAVARTSHGAWFAPLGLLGFVALFWATRRRAS